MITLSQEQQSALDAITDWYRQARADLYGPGRGQVFKTFGPAGTGKTTLISRLPEALNASIVYGTYTGKAAHVLRRKGIPATTIHSAIYRPVGNAQELRMELDEAQRELAEVTEEWAEAVSYPGGGSPDVWGPLTERKEDLEAEIEKLENALQAGVQFELNPDSEWGKADLIVLDEVSMVNQQIADDILSFGVPVLVLGDPAQLPPIGGQGVWTCGEPDVRLKEIHRQALESPVLELATRIRRGQGFKPGEIVRASIAEAMRADQIIVWRNATRWNLISKIRQELGRPAGRPVAGDRIICLQNNRDAGLLNGMQFAVTAVRDGFDEIRLTATDDDGARRELRAYPEGFQGLAGEVRMGKERRAWSGPRGAFTFAQVVTCHKAQGSEWPYIYVVDPGADSMGDERAYRRWVYTAISRASDRVTVARRGA